MIQDDQSREILKAPRSAESRVSTIARALARLEATVAVKLTIERPVPQTTPEIPIQPQLSTEVVSATMQPKDNGELDIASIRSHLDQVYLDQPSEIQDEAA